MQGETHILLTRESMQHFEMDAIVVQYHGVDITAGMPFLVKYKITIDMLHDEVVVDGYSPISYCPPNQTAACQVNRVRCDREPGLLPDQFTSQTNHGTHAATAERKSNYERQIREEVTDNHRCVYMDEHYTNKDCTVIRDSEDYSSNDSECVKQRCVLEKYCPLPFLNLCDKEQFSYVLVQR